MRPIPFASTLFLAMLFFGETLRAGDPQASLDTLIAEQTQGEVAWRTGGVGHDERETLTQLRHRYNLKLIFAEKGTLAFVADVSVRIAKPSGESVLEASADGPWFVVRLPPGTYEVTATAGSATQSQTVQVADTGQAELRFYW
jgi:hypothetical protein